MATLAKVIAVLLVCWLAALSARHAHNSEAWQRALVYTIMLPWPTIGVARWSGWLLEGLMVAVQAGVFSTMVALLARLPAVGAATLVSLAVLLVAPYGTLLGLLDRGMEEFLRGHITMTVEFFLSGWLIAALVLRLRRP